MKLDRLKIVLMDLKGTRDWLYSKADRLLIEHKDPRRSTYEVIEDYLDGIENETEILNDVIRTLEGIVSDEDDFKDSVNDTTQTSNKDSDRLGLNIDINEDVSEDVKKKLKSLITTRKAFCASIIRDLKETKTATEVIKQHLENNVNSVDLEAIDKEIVVVDWVIDAIANLKGNNDGTIKLNPKSKANHDTNIDKEISKDDDVEITNNETNVVLDNTLKEFISNEINSGLMVLHNEMSTKISNLRVDIEDRIDNAISHLENIINKGFDNNTSK